jgi:phosphatidylserine/phosphatidylglycerophosphate/cardiolipin synthase-like enzyme
MPSPESLADLAARYMPRPTDACPVFVESSDFAPVIDGVTYFTELAGLMDRLGAGDAVYIASFQADPRLDLTGRAPDDPGYRPFIDVLTEKAADGVDVRIVLSDAEFSGGVPWLPFGPFRANVRATRAMRAWVPSTRPGVAPPLADRILLDWSGPPLGSNHQKLVVFRIDGELIAYVGGLDLTPTRYDTAPHHRLRLGVHRWGWHDAATRVHGPAAHRVWQVFRARWETAASLPTRYIAKNLPEQYFRLPRGGFTTINPLEAIRVLPPIPDQPDRPAAGTAVQVVRSFSAWSVRPRRGLRRIRPASVSRAAYHEVYVALTTAINAAERYIYLEDQYFHESPGGDARYELYGELRDAARRGVKIILVGSGRRDPADGGDSTVAPVVTRDLRRRVLDRLPPAVRRNVVMYRLRDLTVHTKLMLADDVFASIGSANFFSRSMAGTDSELSCTLVTAGDGVRDLRVRLWAEHLRAPLTDAVRPLLENLDTALGIWRAEWLPPDCPPDTWRRAGSPAGFAPAERVLTPARYYRRVTA